MHAYIDNLKDLSNRNQEILIKFYQKGLELRSKNQILELEESLESSNFENDELYLHHPCENVNQNSNSSIISSRSSDLSLWSLSSCRDRRLKGTIFIIFFIGFVKIDFLQDILIKIFDFFSLKFLILTIINIFNQVLSFSTPETIVY
ncbi:unnamed protein product [Brachionus calyciflorus]|uniref:Uncharacterized protein n=1 Tax=Brachionus calyciflorus TaxID=104777 RepID=A0A813M6F5_9BILA|nr:unnamed protein product [Brachionus calyciflorus]